MTLVRMGVLLRALVVSACAVLRVGWEFSILSDVYKFDKIDGFAKILAAFVCVPQSCTDHAVH